ncbi:hypothetical protein F4677DRAFT_399346 [Hypoxylon crocopeplum]|nr:hypothetical protein F4677DRAFT_399346 [Hypoxylon crocopeplum]
MHQMTEEIIGASSKFNPRFTGLRYLTEEYIWSVVINYSYNGVTFYVLVSAGDKETPPGYELHNSIEGKILIELSDLTFGEETDEKDARSDQLQDELAKLAGDVCLPMMQELAPPTPLPEPRTLQEQIYPETYTLQVLTMDNKLICHKLDSYNVPIRHPPISAAQLQEIDLDDDIMILDPSQIVLGPRLQGLVWKVEANGETMICKVTFDIFGNALGDELAVYQKLKGAGDKLKTPKLKGVVKSHTGIIAILLDYIPHKHHSLRILLRCVEDGTRPRNRGVQVDEDEVGRADQRLSCTATQAGDSVATTSRSTMC